MKVMKLQFFANFLKGDISYFIILLFVPDITTFSGVTSLTSGG